MPPKKAKLHELAVEIPAGYKFVDHRKKEFVFGKQFASGGFGRIYTCTEAGKKVDLCVKVEPSGNGPLFVEVAVFQRALLPELVEQYIKEKKVKSVGVPVMISAGIFEYKAEKLRYLIMPKFGLSLEAIRSKTGKLAADVTLTVAKAVTRALEYLHSKSYTHGDVKADNILLPTEKDFEGAVLVDFGLARLASSNQEKADKKRAHSGTAPFTSIDAHAGFQPSYRGDIEILVYNIIYWINGALPWEKQTNLPVIHAAKEQLRRGGEAEFRKLLGPAIGPHVYAIARMAEQTGYTDTVDMGKVLTHLDAAVQAVKKSAPTTTTKAVNGRTTPKASPAAASKKKGKEVKPVPKRRMIVASSESEEDEEEKVVAQKKVEKKEKDDDEPPPAMKRASTKKAAPAHRSLVATPVGQAPLPSARRESLRSSMTPTSSKSNGTDELPIRKRRSVDKGETAVAAKRAVPVKKDAIVIDAGSGKLQLPPKKAASAVVQRKAATSSSSENGGEVSLKQSSVSVPVPGMRNVVAKAKPPAASVVEAKKTPAVAAPPPTLVTPRKPPSLSGEDEDSDDEAPAAGVDSATKASGSKLRAMVPGMRNLEKGRRSMLIKKIAQKHKK